MEETRKQKALQRDQREKRKIQRHFQTRNTPLELAKTAPVTHELELDGLRFQVLSGGSKLTRVRGKIPFSPTTPVSISQYKGVYDSAAPTPKQATIGGVTFFRSKNGNLYRSGIVKAKK